MTILQEGFEAVAKSLRDFGYSDVTAATIETGYNRWKRGEAPQGIIEMMAERQFEDYPKIFGTQDAA